MGNVYGFLFCFLLLQSPNVSALMKLESHTQYMPEGKWIPLLIPAAPVLLVVLQDRKLCEQEFSIHDLESLSFPRSGCARLCYLDTEWNVSAGKPATGRRLFSCSCCIAHMRDVLCSLLVQALVFVPALGLVPKWSLSFAISPSRCLLVSSLLSQCPLAGAWRVERY